MSQRASKSQKLMTSDSPTFAQTSSEEQGYLASKKNDDGSTNPEGLASADDVDSDITKIGLLEFLDFDPRPTLVFDIESVLKEDFRPLFANSSFRSNIQPTTDSQDAPSPTYFGSEAVAAGFSSLVKAFTQEQATEEPSNHAIIYNGFIWSGFPVRQRWVLVCGSKADAALSDTSTEHPHGYGHARSYSTSFSDRTTIAPYQPSQATYSRSGEPQDNMINTKDILDKPTPDWTAENPIGYMSEHILFAREVDWSLTPLGHMSTWTPEFRQLVNMLMANRHPAAIFWGEELTVLYNQTYGDTVAGLKHPYLMGTGFRGPFAEIWNDVGEIFEECRRTGVGVAMSNQMLPIERRGFVEETFYTWTITPIWHSDGSAQLLGLYNAPFETTKEVVNDRRTKTLLRLSEETALATSVSAFWRAVMEPLVDNEFDFPFVLLYSVADDGDSDDRSSKASSTSSDSSQTLKSVVLEGSLGIPEGHTSAQTKLDLKKSIGGYVPALRDAMKTRQPTRFSLSDSMLPSGLTQGYEWRGYGEPCKDAVVCPLRPTNGENILGFLVIGISPRRPFDEDYESFIRLLNRQLATSLASVTLFQDEIRRGNTAAEVAYAERRRLSEELAFQRSRLQRIAEVSPVGMFSLDSDGTLLEANDRYYEILSVPRDTASKSSWMDTIAPSSLPTMIKGWETLTVHHLPWSGELQLKKPWYDPVTGDMFDNWILASYQHEFSSDGVIKSIMGYCTDISIQKQFARELEQRVELSEQLLHQRNQAREIERNFKRFSDLAPGGLAILDPSGAFTYANDQWFFIAGVAKQKQHMHLPLLTTGAIDEIDREYYATKWVELTTKLLPITMELRMANPWVGDIAGSVLTIQRWLLATFSPELDDDGNLKSVMGCSTDISRIKWAEDLQDRRLREADKTRRQQNSFIDITSHEMRNPLSAIVQCADGISSSLRQYKATKGDLDTELALLIKEGVDAAETIQLCAQHQKSIVDDILTISRLDSNLLLITPVSTKPVEVVKLGLKMFTGECQMHSIALNLEIKPSFTKLRVDSVMLDSSRLTQILINLMTNAIKFTKNEKTRAINVSISAYRDPPSQIEGLPDFEWFPSPNKSTKDDITAGEEWGPGQILYLRFEVRDTGCGLTPAEKSNLFTRFTQASPRTHVHYGGSGLGLFISRQLAELQGGEIGAASTFGKGSTFSFYIKCRRSLNRANSIDVESQLSSDLEGNARLATNVPKSIKDHEETTLSKLLDLHSEGLLNTNDPSSYGFEEEETTAPSPIRKPSYLLPTSWHVLIVEDNLVNQKVLAAQIKKLGCTAYVANHGKEAIDFLMKTDYWVGDGSEGEGTVESRGSTPEAGVSPGTQLEANLKQSLSLILLDIEMPIMDGLTCVRKIREMEASGQVRGHVPVIAVTANARSEQVTSAMQAGMDEVMSKPFRMVQLVPMIESLLIRTRRDSPEGRGEVIPIMNI